MNREIKFRAWDTQRGIWSNITKAVSLVGDPVYIDADDHLHKVAGVVLMQYTGLKDMHGKEIYEGDIVKNPGLKAMRRKVVRWVVRTDYIGWNLRLGFTEYTEIIGNIHESPELLKEAV